MFDHMNLVTILQNVCRYMNIDSKYTIIPNRNPDSTLSEVKMVSANLAVKHEKNLFINILSNDLKKNGFTQLKNKSLEINPQVGSAKPLMPAFFIKVKKFVCEEKQTEVWIRTSGETFFFNVSRVSDGKFSSSDIIKFAKNALRGVKIKTEVKKYAELLEGGGTHAFHERVSIKAKKKFGRSLIEPCSRILNDILSSGNGFSKRQTSPDLREVIETEFPEIFCWTSKDSNTFGFGTYWSEERLCTFRVLVIDDEILFTLDMA